MSNNMLKVISHENGDVYMEKDVTYRDESVTTGWFRDSVMSEVAEQVFGDGYGYTHSIYYNKEKDVFKVVFATCKYDKVIELPLTIAQPFFDSFCDEEAEEYSGVQADTNPTDHEGYILIYKKPIQNFDEL